MGVMPFRRLADSALAREENELKARIINAEERTAMVPA
jgi:hypothetical protein